MSNPTFSDFLVSTHRDLFELEIAEIGKQSTHEEQMTHRRKLKQLRDLRCGVDSTFATQVEINRSAVSSRVRLTFPRTWNPHHYTATDMKRKPFNIEMLSRLPSEQREKIIDLQKERARIEEDVERAKIDGATSSPGTQKQVLEKTGRVLYCPICKQPDKKNVWNQTPFCFNCNHVLVSNSELKKYNRAYRRKWKKKNPES